MFPTSSDNVEVGTQCRFVANEQGVWTFPDQREVEIVTQCKNEKKPVGVQHVREFHGVLSFFPPNTLGVFAASAGYSIYAQR